MYICVFYSSDKVPKNCFFSHRYRYFVRLRCTPKDTCNYKYMVLSTSVAYLKGYSKIQPFVICHWPPTMENILYGAVTFVQTNRSLLSVLSIEESLPYDKVIHFVLFFIVIAQFKVLMHSFNKTHQYKVISVTL